MGALKTILSVCVGVGMVVGAAAAWKFWQVDGFVAFLAGAAGVSLVGAGLGVKFE